MIYPRRNRSVRQTLNELPSRVPTRQAGRASHSDIELVDDVDDKLSIDILREFDLREWPVDSEGKQVPWSERYDFGAKYTVSTRALVRLAIQKRKLFVLVKESILGHLLRITDLMDDLGCWGRMQDGEYERLLKESAHDEEARRATSCSRNNR